jgi:hypothetical protein
MKNKQPKVAEKATTAVKAPPKLSEENRVKLKAKLDRWWSEDSGARKRIDWQWFLFDLWKEGHHYMRYDARSRQIVGAPVNDGKPKVTINKIAPTIRAIVNYALRNRPKAEVTPDGIAEDALDEITQQNLFLDYLHERLGMRLVERGCVEESLSSGISWVQVLWDQGAEDGQGQITVNEIDKYDLYWQKGARTPEEAKRFCLAVVRNIDDLKNDPLYKGANWDDVKADNRQSSSSLKEMLMRLETGAAIGSGNAENDKGSVLVKEWWYYGDKELSEDPKKIYVCTYAGETIIRDPEATDLDRMPFFRLCVSRKKLSMVGKSWIKDLIPLNKRLNSLMSALAEYNVVMNKVVMFADKGAGVRTFKNEFGLIYEKKRGYQITSAAPGSPSTFLIQEIEKILQLFEDIGSVHDATMGRIPTGAKSGKALEALQVGDSNNLSEVVENTEIWLEELYEYILSLAASKYQFARNITPVTRTGQREFLQVIGEEAASQMAADDTNQAAMENNQVVVKKKNVVDVKISSYLAHTPEGRKEAVKELASIIPDLPEEVILEAYEIGPIADIIQKIKRKREEQRAMELQQMSAEQAMNQPPQAGAREAMAVIRSLLQGQAPDLPQVVGDEFIAYFDKFIADSQQNGDVDPRMLQLLQRVRDQLVATQGQNPGMSNGAGMAGRAGRLSPRGGSSPRNTPAGSSPS